MALNHLYPKASIIGGEYDNNRLIMSLQSIVFLNRGGKDGLQKGQRLVVNANHFLRNPETKVNGNSWASAVVKLIRVEDNFSTAVVLTASEMLIPGDFTGEPRKKMAVNKTSKSDDSIDGQSEDQFENNSHSGGNSEDF